MTHELPSWWSDAKFGVFIHWGLYSVPAYAPLGENQTYAEWYWFTQHLPGLGTYEHHAETYGTELTYDDFIDDFTADRFDPDAWVDLLEASGARYFVLTAKHHDGFSLWPTRTTDRNSMAMGPHRDVVGELLNASHNSDLKAGIYYSLPEWYNPAPRPDWNPGDPLEQLAFGSVTPPTNPYTGEEVPYAGYRPIEDYAADHVIPQIKELTETYRPDILWCDIGGDPTYYQSDAWIADYYNGARASNPDGVVANDRCGDPLETHFDYTTVEYGNGERRAPFEATQGMGTSFGYNAEETKEDYQSVSSLLHTLIETVADGGNLLLNIGPRADGTIPEAMVERLQGIGAWLEVNGDAIYGSNPSDLKANPKWRVTIGADGARYLILRNAPSDTYCVDPAIAVDPGTEVTLLGPTPTRIEHRIEDGQVIFDLTDLGPKGGSPIRDGLPVVFRLEEA